MSIVQDAQLLLVIKARDESKAVLDSAGGNVKSFGDHFGVLGDVASKGFAIAAQGAAIAGTAISGFGVAAVEHTIASGQAAYEMSEKFGLLPEQSSAWIAAGAQLGVGADQIGIGMKTMSKQMELANIAVEQGKAPPAALGQVMKDLGVNLLDSSGHMRSMQDVMFDVSNAFLKMPDGPEKAAEAVKLFGKSGTDLLPMLNDGSAGIKDLMEKAKANGDVMSGPMVKGAHDAYLAQKNLNEVISGIALTVGSLLVGPFTSMSAWMSDYLPKAAKVVGDYFQQHLMPIVQAVGDWVTRTFIPALQSFVGYVQTQVIPALMSIAQWFGDHIWPIIKQVADWFRTEMVPRLQELVQSIRDNVLPALLSFETFLVEHVTKPAIAFAETVIPPVLDALKWLSDHIWIVEAALAAIVARWVIIQGLAIGAEVAKMGAAFALMAGQQGVGSAVGALMGFGGPGGAMEKVLRGMAGFKTAAAEMGGASTAAGLGAGALALGLGALVLAAAAVIFNVGGSRDALHNFFYAAGDASDGLKTLNDSMQDNGRFFSEWTGGAAVDLNKLQDQFNANQGFTDKLNGNMERAAGNLRMTIQVGGQQAAAVISNLANSKDWGSINDFEKQIAASGGDVVKALQAMADQGGPSGETAKAMIAGLAKQSAAAADAAAKRVIASKVMFDTLQQQNLDFTQGEIGATQSAYDTINAVYGTSAQKYIDAWNLMHPAEAAHMEQVQTIATALGISVTQVEQLGQAGALTYGGITGTTAAVIANMDAVNARLQTTNYYAQLTAGQFGAAAVAAGKISQSVADINHNAAAAGAGISLQGGKHAAGGKFTTPHWAQIAEGGETEWVIPAHRARGYEAMLDALLGGAMPPPVAMGSAAPAATRSAPAGAGGMAFGGGGFGGAPIVLEVHTTSVLDGRVVSQSVSKHLGQGLRLQMASHSGNA